MGRCELCAFFRPGVFNDWCALHYVDITFTSCCEGFVDYYDWEFSVMP